MLFLDLLEGTQSKTKVLEAIAYIGDQPSKFKQFVNEFMQADKRNSQKLSWIIGKIADTQPQLILPFIPDFINKLRNPCHAAVKRNILRALSIHGVPRNLFGEVADIAFRMLDDPSETIAVRAFSMSILHDICLCETDLSLELIPVLEYHIPHSSAGFRARANKIIASLA